MIGGSRPSVAAWCALGLLAVVIELDLGWELRRRGSERARAPRHRRPALVLPLLVAFWLLILLAADHTVRRVIWWIMAVGYGGGALYLIWAPLAVGVVRKPGLPALRAAYRRLDRPERAAGRLILALMAGAALLTLLGTTVLTVVSGDFQFALALSVAGSFVLRCYWRWLVRRHTSAPPAAPA